MIMKPHYLRYYQWSPDEATPAFYNDPNIFISRHKVSRFPSIKPTPKFQNSILMPMPHPYQIRLLTFEILALKASVFPTLRR